MKTKILAVLAALAGPAHAAELPVPVSVAADGPVIIAVVENRPMAFPDYYVVNALFKARGEANVFSVTSRENRIGDANPLPGVPGDSLYRPFTRGMPLVFQLVPFFAGQQPRFGSISTTDPAGLTKASNPGLAADNAQRALVRQLGADVVEIAFPGPYGTPASFEEYPVRIRITNATSR